MEAISNSSILGSKIYSTNIPWKYDQWQRVLALLFWNHMITWKVMPIKSGGCQRGASYNGAIRTKTQEKNSPKPELLDSALM